MNYTKKFGSDLYLRKSFYFLLEQKNDNFQFAEN